MDFLVARIVVIPIVCACIRLCMPIAPLIESLWREANVRPQPTRSVIGASVIEITSRPSLPCHVHFRYSRISFRTVGMATPTAAAAAAGKSSLRASNGGTELAQRFLLESFRRSPALVRSMMLSPHSKDDEAATAATTTKTAAPRWASPIDALFDCGDCGERRPAGETEQREAAAPSSLPHAKPKSTSLSSSQPQPPRHTSCLAHEALLLLADVLDSGAASGGNRKQMLRTR
eukprot:GHVU01147206.1.p1 GENE.GHVU01147206.1~~GHVU01147206.1.p1  ORF type:complete len:232 (+),score=20.50 GHVU01147206.1:1405-2100(+)